MKKLLIVLMLATATLGYAKEKHCNSLDRDIAKLDRLTTENYTLVSICFERPNRKSIRKTFNNLEKTEKLINHITDEHFATLRERDARRLFDKKYKIFQTKKELYYLRKTLVGSKDLDVDDD